MSEEPPFAQPKRLSGHDPAALIRLGLPPKDDAATLEIPGYEVLDSLGHGGMGEVFRARQESLGREVAIKVLRNESGGSEWLPERFEREARTMATLRHPNVVTVHDCVRLDGGRVAIVMELVRCGTLRARIAAARDGLPLPDVLRWAREIADGLRVAHEAGVTHRDVKPENMLIDDTEAARVSDFGIAFSTVVETTRYTQTGRALGTLGYMAPEQLRGGSADARGDVFSLGVMLYEMVTGRLPQGSFRPAREVRAAIPPELDRLILEMLRPEPELRPPSMAAIVRRLEGIARNPSGPFITRRRMLVSGTAAAIAGAILWPDREKQKSPRDGEWRRIAWSPDAENRGIMGGWKLDGTTLVSDGAICIFPVAQELPRSWAVRMRFRRIWGINSIAIFFRTPEGTGTFTLASWASNLGGVQNIAGKTVKEEGAFAFEIENGRAYEWVVEYRAGRTRIWVDGTLMQERDITAQPLSVAAPWDWRPGLESPALMIGSWKSSVRFEWMEWRVLDQQ